MVSCIADRCPTLPIICKHSVLYCNCPVCKNNKNRNPSSENPSHVSHVYKHHRVTFHHSCRVPHVLSYKEWHWHTLLCIIQTERTRHSSCHSSGYDIFWTYSWQFRIKSLTVVGFFDVQFYFSWTQLTDLHNLSSAQYTSVAPVWPMEVEHCISFNKHLKDLHLSQAILL